MATINYSMVRLRASIADAAWVAVERAAALKERLVTAMKHGAWDAEDAWREALDVAKWPFERIAWAVERGLIWPVENRTSQLGEPFRVAGIAIVGATAIGVGVLGLVLTAPNDGGDPTAAQLAVPTRVPIASKAPSHEATASNGPVLHGISPVFKPKPGAKSSADTVSKNSAPANTPTSPSSTPAQPGGVEAGTGALKVARHFADAFVLYEIGKSTSEARAAFRATATSQLAHSLLQRPPRLPENVKVPKAKVVNLVPGPSHDGIYTISVSLLRVGVTSELRLEMQPVQKGRASRVKPQGTEWRVTDVTG